MSIGAPTEPPAHPRKKRRGTFSIIVGVGALAVLLAIDVPALRALDESWGVAGVGGSIAALIGAALAHIWFDGGSRSNFEYYFWKRLLALAIVTALASLAAHFVLDWPLLPSAATGLAIALLGGMAVMLASGDLKLP